MPETSLLLTIAAYVVLVVLLLSLNVLSLWRWWVKAGAIIVTTACIVLAYFSISGMIGWPTSDKLPGRFNVVATRIVEPDPQAGRAGHVYLWVEELNEHSVPITPPRGYEIPYTPQLADDTDTAQKKINSGQQVMGQTQTGTEAAQGQKINNAVKSNDQSGAMTGKAGEGATPSGETTAAETIGEAQTIVFSDMPAVDLPDKANEPPPQ